MAHVTQDPAARAQVPGTVGALHRHLLSGPEADDVRQRLGQRGWGAHSLPSMRSSAQTSLPHGRLPEPRRS